MRAQTSFPAASAAHRLRGKWGGKSAVRQLLEHELSEVVVLESDLLWRSEFDRPDKHRDFFETWLRLCKGISRSGRPVVIFGAGFGAPKNLEQCVERRYFSGLHYLALVCADEMLEQRLRARPAWRKSDDLAYIEAHVAFNRWFKQNASQVEPDTGEALDSQQALKSRHGFTIQGKSYAIPSCAL
jgi:hypothetical protein